MHNQPSAKQAKYISLGASRNSNIQTQSHTSIHLFHIYDVKFKHFYLLRDRLKSASQYCHDSVSNEQENTTRLAQYLYHTVFRVKRIGITTLYDVFSLYPAGYIVKFFTQQKRRKYVLSRLIRSSDQTTTSFPVLFPRGLYKH